MDWEIVEREKAKPVGSHLRHFLPNWEKLTQSPWVLEAVSGYRLELFSSPRQVGAPATLHMDNLRGEALASELKALREKRAVEPVDDVRESFISPMFVVPKGDGAWRPVINLRSLNQHVTPHHFKMEGIRVVKGLIQKGDWMVKLDLKDAYLSVPIHPQHRKFLRFKWEDQLWQFSSLPFGLSSAPYVFTKLLKPVVTVLRKLGIRCVLYLDDMLIMAQSKERLRSYLATAVELLVSLGFIINTKKSIFSPSQVIEFLGFILDSRVMTIALPNRKIHQIHKLIRRVLEEREVSTRQLAQLLGSLVAAHPAVLPAPLYFRHLERVKFKAALRGGYDSRVCVDPQIRKEMSWWLDRLITNNGSNLQITHWDLFIESDASMQGWGASCKGASTRGPWTRDERTHHINFLELLASFLALKTFAADLQSKATLLRIDNVTAVAYLNKMGGTHSSLLSNLAVDIWISKEEIEAVMVAPVWQNQVWYPRLLELLSHEPILLPETQNILSNTEGGFHPLALQGHLPLAAWPISGKPSVQRDFQRELSRCSPSHGEDQRKLHTVPHGGHGIAGVRNGVCIHFQPL